MHLVYPNLIDNCIFYFKICVQNVFIVCLEYFFKVCVQNIHLCVFLMLSMFRMFIYSVFLECFPLVCLEGSFIVCSECSCVQNGCSDCL